MQFEITLPPDTRTPGTPDPAGDNNLLVDAALALSRGLQFLTGGGTISTATITAAQGLNFQGIYLDPRFVWDMSGLVINAVQNFVIESAMMGSIGWTGHISWNSTGYIKTDTGSPADGIQVYASTPGGTTQTQGIIFRNCVFKGSHSASVIHYGGGQRRCGLVDCLVYNTSTAAGAYAVKIDSGLSDNNSENMIMSFTGGGGLAGGYAALGIGISDQTQHANDTWYYGLATSSAGAYSIVKNNGGGHTFVEHYDRSSPSVATVWNHGGGRLQFYGGEHQNNTGLSHLVDSTSAKTIINGATVTNNGSANTIQVSAGSLIFRDFVTFNGANTLALSGTGVIDLSDPALGCSNATVSGSAGTLLLAGNYAGQGSAPVLTSWTGTTAYQGPFAVSQGSFNSQTSTKTITWTPPAAITHFRVSVWVRVQTHVTSTVANLAFTEFSGTADSFALPMLKMDGAAVTPVVSMVATGLYRWEGAFTTDASATNVVLTVTPTSDTFRMSYYIEQLP